MAEEQPTGTVPETRGRAPATDPEAARPASEREETKEKEKGKRGRTVSMAFNPGFILFWIDCIVYLAFFITSLTGVGIAQSGCNSAAAARGYSTDFCEVRYRNNWYRVLFTFCLVVIFFVAMALAGLFRHHEVKIASASMLTIGSLLLTESSEYWSVNNYGGGNHTAFAGALGSAIALYAMVITVAMWDFMSEGLA